VSERQTLVSKTLFLYSEEKNKKITIYSEQTEHGPK